MAKLKLDLHDIYNKGDKIEIELKRIMQEAVDRRIELVEIIPGKGSGRSFGGHAGDAAVVLQNGIPVALKKAEPGTREFRRALRDAQENTRDLPAALGIFNMTANDHQGFDQRARVMVTIENNTWKLLK